MFSTYSDVQTNFRLCTFSPRKQTGMCPGIFTPWQNLSPLSQAWLVFVNRLCIYFTYFSWYFFPCFIRLTWNQRAKCTFPFLWQDPSLMVSSFSCFVSGFFQMKLTLQCKLDCDWELSANKAINNVVVTIRLN